MLHNHCFILICQNELLDLFYEHVFSEAWNYYYIVQYNIHVPQQHFVSFYVILSPIVIQPKSATN